MKSVIIVLFFLLGLTTTGAQNNSPFVINVLINADKSIKIEGHSVTFEEVQEVTKSILHNRKFILDEKIIFKIYGHEDLILGYVMDVENEMAKATNENTTRLRYLLNTNELYLDGSEWIRKVKELNLKPVNKS